MRVALLTSGPSRGGSGGAERLFHGLLEGLRASDCEAEMIFVPADEPSFQAILDNHTRCAFLDLAAFDVVISTKAPTYAVRHPAHVMYLIHTVRVFDDMFDAHFPAPTPEHYRQRAQLHAIEFEPMNYAKARFAIGQEIADRLYRWRGLHAETLHPPLLAHHFRAGPTGDYFFLPGRLHPWKRVDLVIASVRASSLPLRLKIAGTGEAEMELRQLAGDDPRIEFLGRISDEALIELYAGALAVPFLPLREDYGYITLEAFASGKPVITCSDSGEPCRLVRHGETGLICRPEPEAVKEALEILFRDRERAAAMGARAMQLVARMPTWPQVARHLLTAATAPTRQFFDQSLRVCVLDMQPITPAVGGGRLRLLGLYHALGENIRCTYVGSYDWPGEKERHQALTPTLEEIDIPLSTAHHEAARSLAMAIGGKTVIDISFGRLGTLSPDYVAAARASMQHADIVVFSHPWVYPLVADTLAPTQTVVYESHNVEGFLRAQFLADEVSAEAELLLEVVEAEYALARRADLVLACSQEDLERFNRLYQISANKLRVVPNGVMAYQVAPPSPNEKQLAKQALGVTDWALVGFFIGSAYTPNLEAAQFIIEQLAPVNPEVLFVIAGGVGTHIHATGSNLRVAGPISDTERAQWLRAADIAVNPMFSGSGTNIKMFDFMAAGLPTVTTRIGARGIETAGQAALIEVAGTPEAFSAAIAELHDPSVRERQGTTARKCVEEGYAWERISPLLGLLLRARQRYHGQTQPLFSVIIPTWERHGRLDILVQHLQAQIERDFEVVIIDQSVKPWPGRAAEYGFPMLYHHSPVKGAVRARNTGAYLAQGRILAFTDDDCEPREDWLVHARPYFDDPRIVGVEGKITSDHPGDSRWRPVTNVGFEGFGFMTANLLVRAECFRILGGFDLAFDNPHFREDTDFGWRLQSLGEVPYGADVRVFHPAQPRTEERESSLERARFFRKDALLYRKHPLRYQELFFAEGQFRINPAFGPNLIAGFNDLGIPLPKWIGSLALLSQHHAPIQPRGHNYDCGRPPQ